MSEEVDFEMRWFFIFIFSVVLLGAVGMAIDNYYRHAEKMEAIRQGKAEVQVERCD